MGSARGYVPSTRSDDVSGPRSSSAAITGRRRRVALQVQVEAVLPRRAGDGPRLQLGEVHPPLRQSRAAPGPSAPGLVLQHDHQRRLARHVRRERRGLARQLHEARVVPAAGWMSAPSTCRPKRCAADSLAMAATVGRCARAPCGPRRRCRTPAAGGSTGHACAGSPRTAPAPADGRAPSAGPPAGRPAAQQPVIHLAHHFAGDDAAALGEHVVRLVHAASGGVLDGQQRQVLLARGAAPPRPRGRSRSP